MALSTPSGTPEGLGGGFIPTVVLDSEKESTLRQLTQLELYWKRFRTHRLALLGAIILLLIVLMAIFAPLITPGVLPSDIHPLISLENPAYINGAPPTFANFPWRLFGTTGDLNGSILAQITYGARVSLMIGFISAFFASMIGTILGAVSGYFGGWVDMLLMRITDMFLAIPFLPLLIAISAIYARGNDSPVLVIVIFSATSWPGVARLVRASYLTFREQEFTEAAKATGVNDWRIIFRHILPNALSPVIVTATLQVAGFIVTEAALDYLGVGLNFQIGDPKSIASWGNVLAGAQDTLIVGNWWWPTFPGIFLVLTVLAVNFIGDGLRDALDVRSRL